MAEKKKKTRTGKTATKKKAATPKRQKSAPVSKAPADTASSPQRAPLYLLIILILLAVIIILANQYFTGERGKSATNDNAAVKAAHKMQETDSRVSSHDKKIEEKGIHEQKNAEPPKKESSQATESRMKIYFLRVDDRTERVTLVPVTRHIKGEASLEKALNELIKGPNSGERSKGILSAVPSNIRIRGALVKNGVAEIDFNDAVEKNAAGSILISRLDQIIYTATEIEGVHSVIIKINGKRKQVFGSDGLSIGGPLHRRQ